MSTISASTTSTTAYKVTADTTGTLVLQTGATPTTAVTIDSSQNVGIGTSSPTEKFNVVNSGSYAAMRVSNGTNSSLFGYANADGNYNTGAKAGDAIIRGAVGVSIESNNGTSGMRIDSSGNLLIGTTTARAGNNSMTFESGNCYYQLRKDGTGSVQQIQFVRATDTTPVGVGTITTTGSSTAYGTSSDYRLKHDIQPMSGALAKVSQLNPVTYKWNIDGSNGEGFIAHELQAVVPDCVTGEKDAIETFVDEEGNEQTRPVYQGIDTSFLVATLTAAIQELKAELDAAKADIATLKGAA
jgi:hypothetical protein